VIVVRSDIFSVLKICLICCNRRQNADKAEQAVIEYERALPLMKTRLGSNHHKVGEALSNYAQALALTVRI